MRWTSSSMLELCLVGSLAVLAACGSKDSDNDIRPQAGQSGGVSGGGTGGASAGAGAGAGGSEAGTEAMSDAAVGTPTGTFDAGSEDDRNKVTPGMICDRMSTIQCAGEAACCESPGRTLEQCKADMQGGCSTMLYLDEIAMNAITHFDAAAAEAAFTHFEELASKCDSTIAAWGASDTGLRTMLAGTVAPGGSCPIKASATAPEAGAALTSCTNLATTACMFHSIAGVAFPINWTCDAKAGVGGACFTDVNCTTGLYCDNPDAKFSAQCKERKPAGQSCVNPNECQSLFCKGSMCVEADQKAAYCLKN